MTSLPLELALPTAERAQITADTLSVELSDGRTISAPLAWFPRLMHATPAERNRWRLIGRGQGIHWEDIDEDISVDGLLAGRPSGESQASFKKWLAARTVRTKGEPGRTRRQPAVSDQHGPDRTGGIRSRRRSMKVERTLPQPFAVRKVGDRKWEVLIGPENMWLSTETEGDARVIARAPVLEHESLEKIRSGSAFAVELEQIASTFEKYRIGFGSRFFRRRAEEARNA